MQGYLAEIFPILDSSEAAEFAMDDAAFTLVQPLRDRSSTSTSTQVALANLL